jgi:YD repeat-containing protein
VQKTPLPDEWPPRRFRDYLVRLRWLGDNSTEKGIEGTFGGLQAPATKPHHQDFSGVGHPALFAFVRVAPDRVPTIVVPVDQHQCLQLRHAEPPVDADHSLTGQFGFGYDAVSRRTQLTRPNSINTNYTYNSVSRLLSVLHQAGSSTLDGASRVPHTFAFSCECMGAA